MKVLIIGGGIGGLTTGIALQRRGIDFDVYEAAPELREVGAGIWVPPNAMNVFERLGVAAKIKREGTVMKEICVGNFRGEVLQTIRAREVIAEYGNATTTIHRGRLQQVLREELEPARVHLGKQLTRFAANDTGVEAFFADGTSARADVLLAADGIHSMAREQLFGRTPLRYSGQTCWRGATAFQLPRDVAHRMIEMWGRGRGLRFAYSQMTPTHVYFYATACEPAGGKDVPGELKPMLKARLAEFPPLVAEIIDSADERAIIRTDLFDFAPIARWSKGRVALLGDAAHATTPNLGQGGAQAIEDAYVIAQALAEAGDAGEAFRRYESIRRDKAVHVVNTSWQYGQVTNWPPGIRTWVRDQFMKRMPEALGKKQMRRLYALNF